VNRRPVLAVSAAGALALVAGALGAAPSQAATACKVTYSVASQWSGGFVAAVTIDNLGDALAGWSLSWDFAAGESVTSAWNATVSQSGSTATATNAGWNGNVASGGSASFGFQGNGTAAVPSSFSLNGTACTGASGGGGTTSTTTSTRPSTTSTSTSTTSTTSRTTSTSTTSRTTTTTSRTSTTTTSAARNTFSNPIKADGADPALQYYNGYYYLSTTTWSTYMNMRRSRTLEGLKTASDTRIWNADNSNRGYNFWAPDFQRLTSSNGTRWYYMFSAGHQADLDLQHLVVLESSGDDPMGPYSFKGEPLGTSWGIDGQYLQVNGNLYLLYSAWSGSNQNIYIRRMTNPWTVTGSAVLVSSPTYSWEKVGSNVNEGAAVLQRNGRTFITYSASSCNSPDYKLGLLTLNGDPMSSSSWSKSSSPVFSRSDSNGVYGPGHNFFFKSPDGTEDWSAYHANASSSQGCGNSRSTRAQKVTWNSDGTPNFGTPGKTGTTITAPAGEPAG
jgi:GH43 family beta-xylosidase